MGVLHAGLLALLCSTAFGYPFEELSEYGPFGTDAALEWAKMEMGAEEETPPAPAPRAPSFRSASSSESSTPEAKKVPENVVISASEDPKALLNPEKGVRPLPKAVEEMLLVTAPPDTASGSTSRPKLIDALCHADRIYVRILREIFKSKDAYKYLKFGTCPVNQGTKLHYYFLYLLKNDCGFKKESHADHVIISIVLSYKPTTPVLREMPFEVPLQCKYNRYFHSYKVGFYPKLQGGTVNKPLQPKTSFTLTPLDASGNEITGGKAYTLGQPMYFEAKGADTTKPGKDRMYIKKCFMTPSQDPTATPKYVVIDNHGCMNDGKVTEQSKFLTGASKKIQKFRVGSFIFTSLVSSSSSSQQLYMHCEMHMGGLTPSKGLKACNYDHASKKWKELYSNDDSVCNCCDSTCSAAQARASRNVVSSHSWKVNFKNEDGSMESGPRTTKALNPFDGSAHDDFVNYWEGDD